MKTLALVPTYNEAENILTLIKRLQSSVPGIDVLVIDDGSPDGTADLVASLNDPRVQVMRRARKEGLGPAYLAGFHSGIASGYNYLIEIDADGSHQPEELPRLLDAMSEADLVIGSRWIRGGQITNWSILRRVISRAGNFYVRFMLELGVQDATAGFRVYRRDTLERINLDSVRSNGYCFQIDLTRRVIDAGMRVLEVPITFVEREHGQSKMSKAIVIEALWRTTVWGLSRVFSFSAKKR